MLSIVLGILIGAFAPKPMCQVLVTISSLFGTFLKFIIPMMILAYITMGIADLSDGAGRLLVLTTVLSYGSTLIAAYGAFLLAITFFPIFMYSSIFEPMVATANQSTVPLFSISVSPIFDTITAVLLAFILGLSLSMMRGKEIGDTLYNLMDDFSKIVYKILRVIIIPLLPLYICGTFVSMTSSSQSFAILSILWKVFLGVLAMHLLYLFLIFIVAGAISRKNPFILLRNQIPGYIAALGTQSSFAAIPMNLECAEADGISYEVRKLVVPLCANIHMAGSMITITACVTAVCLMSHLPITFVTVSPFIITLSIVMVASPGAPGGAIMTALPFLHLIFGPQAGDINGPICAIMIALYIAQDSFGTACNVSGDNAIGVIVDTVYQMWMKDRQEIC